MYTRTHRFTVPQRHLAWLLWLVLLLPIAQVAASWHALSHAKAGAGDGRDSEHGLHLSHCDLCLTASAIDGGTPLVEPLTLSADAPRFERPRTTPVSVWIAPPASAYLGRAPPITSR